jgi:hypothetical protein
MNCLRLTDPALLQITLIVRGADKGAAYLESW